MIQSNIKINWIIFNLSFLSITNRINICFSYVLMTNVSQIETKISKKLNCTRTFNANNKCFSTCLYVCSDFMTCRLLQQSCLLSTWQNWIVLRWSVNNLSQLFLCSVLVLIMISIFVTKIGIYLFSCEEIMEDITINLSVRKKL